MSAGACAVSAMSPIMVMSSLAGFDNQNGWERYRAALPLSRKDIICARYLSVIVFSAVMACAATLLSIVAIPLFNSAGIPSTGQTVFEIAIASAASMLISLMMVLFGAAAVLSPWTHGGAAPIRWPVCPARVPCHGHAELLQSPLATGLCRLPERIPTLPFWAVCVQASPHLPSRYVQSAAPSAPRFIEYAICSHASLNPRRA